MNRMIRNKLNCSTILISTMALLWGIVLALPATARDAPCPKGRFPASGQTTAYQADLNDGILGNFVDVPDDGTVEAGATLLYRDNGDGTITDLNTGLEWEKKDSLDNGIQDFSNLHDADNHYLWTANGAQDTIWDWLEKINTVGGTGFAGFDDWRIPNIKELHSIAHFEQAFAGGLPAVHPVFHTNCTAGSTVLTGSCTAPFSTWSSTTYVVQSSLAWAVDFSSGAIDLGGKIGGLRVRAVRSGCL